MRSANGNGRAHDDAPESCTRELTLLAHDGRARKSPRNKGTSTDEPALLPLEPLAVGATRAGALFDISKSHVHSLVAQGLFPPPTKLGDRAVWSLALLRDWCAAGMPPMSRFDSARKGST